ncbi:DUF1493 family protein [Enterobacter roggenkampii]|uniref:DUF1493 family protein n=1 Tax=Enterobacter roggenkampii TaxID=1812935 RepID=UPI003981EF27
MSQAFPGENVTQTVIQTRHTNGCSIPTILKPSNRDIKPLTVRMFADAVKAGKWIHD